MKIILIKDFKIGKENDVLEVSNGYAKNFLIPKKIAIPYNDKTISFLTKKKFLEKKDQKKINEKINKLKNLIENTILTFNVKSNNGIVHNTISKKKLIEELKKNKIEIKSHSIENVKINQLGFINIRISLAKNIEAILKIEVKNAN